MPPGPHSLSTCTRGRGAQDPQPQNALQDGVGIFRDTRRRVNDPHASPKRPLKRRLQGEEDVSLSPELQTNKESGDVGEASAANNTSNNSRSHGLKRRK